MYKYIQIQLYSKVCVKQNCNYLQSVAAIGHVILGAAAHLRASGLGTKQPCSARGHGGVSKAAAVADPTHRVPAWGRLGAGQYP